LTNGVLTLSGTSSDTWVFKSGSSLIITGSASRVSSSSCNVWWRVVSTATLDAGSSFVGNILADTSITMAAGASLAGRALAGTAEVTLISNAITACTVPVPTLPEWAFIMLAVLLAAAGAVVLRRRTLA
jgi:type VI secretion system secreted protein VgrG